MRRARIIAIGFFLAVLAAAYAVAKPYLWPDKHGARSEHFSINSRFVHKRLGVRVIVPAGAGDGAPLLVFLHGRGGNEDSEMRNGPMFDELAALGSRAPVIAFPYGGDHGYWHNRSGAAWSAYVMHEVIPQVEERFHTSTRHIAIGGISMGGYGAFEIAREHPGHFCAVGGHSPAVWRTGGESAPGAFDNAEDFTRHDLVGTARTKPGRFARPRLWLDAGTSDPFQPGDRAFIDALKAGKVQITAHLRWPGGHDNSYWRSHWPAYVAFYARALAHCG